MEVCFLKDCIIIILLAAVFILQLVILLTRKNGKTDGRLDDIEKKVSGFDEKLSREFERSRRENSSEMSTSREENARVMGDLREDMEKLRIDNTERSAKLEKEVITVLGEIRSENGKQNIETSQRISAAIEGMRESNDKKLDDMRAENEKKSTEQTNRVFEAVEKMRESNEKKLEEMRVTVDEKLTSTLTERLDSSFRTVSDRLESVNKSLGEMKELSNGVTTNVTALSRVLTNVKARGTWAEVQLGVILDETLPGMYESNFATVEGSGERVEFAVKIPSTEGKTVYLPVDSKFPMEDYVRLCDAADTGDREALESARKALYTRVQSEAKDVSKYINIPVTTPYAILYLATEGLYAEIVSAKNGIAEKIKSDYNVMIAGPSTITALLNALSLGFRAVAINEKANEVRTLLGAAKQQYDNFGNTLAKVRKKLDEAGSALDDADKRNRIIVKKLKNVESLDGSSADEVLGINEINDTLKEE